MNRTLRNTIVLAGAAIIAAPASAGAIGVLVIDDFNSGTLSTDVSSGVSITQQDGTMAGGQRDVAAFAELNPFSQMLGIDINNGLLSYSSGFGLDGRLTLDYDGSTDVEDGDLPLEMGEGLGLSLAGLTDIEFDFLDVDMDFTLRVMMMDGSAVSEFVDVAVTEGNNQTISLDLSGFSSVDLSDIDRMMFMFNVADGGPGSESLDFTLGGITAIPAPGVLALLGLGAIASRRRRH